MKKLHSVFLTGFLIVLLLPLKLFSASTNECQIISIHGVRPPIKVTPAADETPINIQPQYARVQQGGCVIWVNWVQRPEISITFEGKASQAVVQAPTGFHLSDKKKYTTNYLPQGATVSLRFLQA